VNFIVYVIIVKFGELNNLNQIYISTKLSKLKYACFGRPYYSIKLRERVYSNQLSSINLLGFSVREP